jgi:hypothetical protein
MNIRILEAPYPPDDRIHPNTFLPIRCIAYLFPCGPFESSQSGSSALPLRLRRRCLLGVGKEALDVSVSIAGLFLFGLGVSFVSVLCARLQQIRQQATCQQLTDDDHKHDMSPNKIRPYYGELPTHCWCRPSPACSTKVSALVSSVETYSPTTRFSTVRVPGES